MIDYFFNPQSVEALGWTLLHSVWQGALFALLLVLILIALRSYSAQSRYVVSVGILCAFFMTLSGTFWIQYQNASHKFEIANSSAPAQTVNHVKIINSPAHVPHLNIEQQNANTSTAGMLVTDQTSMLVRMKNYYNKHLPLLVTIWFLGIIFLQLRFLGQLAYVQRLKHYGAQKFPAHWKDRIEELEGKLRIRKKVSYLTSIRVESPMAIGWLKPAVIMPRQLFNSLSETEIYSVLAHELAHIRREDFIVNLMQTFMCNIFFFHPGVWWMSKRIDDEREHCCDDLAVAATGQATSYAKTLINISELQLNMQGNPALAMAFSGKNKRKDRVGFSGRIRRLFQAGNGVGSFREGFATAFILLTAFVFSIAATSSTAQETKDETLADKEQVEVISQRGELNKNEPETKSSKALTTNTSTRAIDEDQVLKENEIKKDHHVDVAITYDYDSVAQSKEQNYNSQSTEKTTTTRITITTEDEPISELKQEVANGNLLIAVPEPSANPESYVNSVQFVRQNDSRIDALVTACYEGDFDFVKTLVSYGIDVNGIGSEGFTPLMMAASYDEHDIVEYLIKEGADVNQHSNGWTALIEAADEGSTESMKLLLKAGAKVNFYLGTQSPTAITMAASEGHLDCLQLLTQNGANVNGVGESMPPLHIAAEEGKRNIVDYLIAQKVDVNKKDFGGHTALMYAASEGNKYIVRILIDAGADASIVDVYGATAQDYAEAEEEYETRALLSDDSLPMLHQATYDGLIEKVQQMVKQGADVNERDDLGRTPLHIAAAENHNIDMRILIDLGANLNAKDKQGRTPLMYAAAGGHKNASVLLVSKVVDVNIEDEDGMRAFEWSQSGNNPDLVDFLSLITERKTDFDQDKNEIKEQIKSKEKSNQNECKDVSKVTCHQGHSNCTNHGNIISNNINGHHNVSCLQQTQIETTALLDAARYGTVIDLSNLIGNGANANGSDETGLTPLMVAASKNRLDIAKQLLEQGADVNQSSHSGLTALHFAALQNHVEIVALLLEYKANLNPTMQYSSTDGNYSNEPIVWEYKGATPLFVAVESGNIEVLSVLIEAGANKDISVIKNEYRLDKDRPTYLSASEVMGLDLEFLEHVSVRVSDHNWTASRQALLLDDEAIISLLKK